MSWLENEALDQCTAAIGPDTEKAENDQDKPPLKPVQASDREEHVYAILEVKEEQDTSSVNGIIYLTKIYIGYGLNYNNNY